MKISEQGIKNAEQIQWKNDLGIEHLVHLAHAQNIVYMYKDQTIASYCTCAISQRR